MPLRLLHPTSGVAGLIPNYTEYAPAPAALLPLRLAAEVQYSLVKPDDIGTDWNFRILVIPVIPNPFR